MVVKNGNVLATGYNFNYNSPNAVSPEHITGVGCHAEVAALRKVKYPKGCTIYVARRRKRDLPGLSAPCNNCAYYLRKAGVKKVFYTDSLD